MRLAIKVRPGESLKLADYDASYTAGITQDKAGEQFLKLSDEIGDLQEMLYSAGQHSILVLLQGMDTSGKDGAIKRVMSQVNPQGCRVESFKVPTEEELAHDFLWRVHAVTPRRGMVTIFNRSHYEDVLVVRVHNLVPPSVWELRYNHINDFEQLLTESGTIILKFFLHISQDEQKKRLEAREEEIEKAWKLSAGDWREREHWEAYQQAYEDAISRCTTTHAPWYIIPANKKWFRNLAIADTIVRALRPYREIWEKTLSEMAQEKLAELDAFKQQRAESET